MLRTGRPVLIITAIIFLIFEVIIPLSSSGLVYNAVNAQADSYLWELHSGKWVSCGPGEFESELPGQGKMLHALSMIPNAIPPLKIQVNINDQTVRGSYSGTQYVSGYLTASDEFGENVHDASGKLNFTMVGTYSSTAGMKGEYTYQADITAKSSKGAVDSVKISLKGSFSGKPLVIIGDYDISFGPGTGTKISNKGTSSYTVPYWTARFIAVSTGASSETEQAVKKAPGPLVDALPAIKGEPLAKLETIEGDGEVYISNESEELPPSMRKWVKAKPGMMLGEGYTIRTSSGAETLIRYSSGAVVRTKQVTWFSIKKPVVTQDSLSTIYGRLWKGMSNFYFPPGHQAQRKFGIETNMVVTGIKGTNFILDETEQGTGLKVLEGSVEIKHKATGQIATVNAGNSISASSNGLSQPTTFNISQEQAKWPGMDSSTSSISVIDDIQQDQIRLRDDDSLSSSLLPENERETSSGISGQTGTTKKKNRIGPFTCFIATATYGSETAQELNTLRSFRDKVLMKSEPGKWFVNTYYQISPPLAELIVEHDELRIIVREMILDPIVNLLKSTEACWNN